MCAAWLEQHLHPTDLVCPHCQSSDRRLFRRHEHFPTYRCCTCQRTYTLLTGSVFEKTRQRPSTIVLLLRGLLKAKVPPACPENSILIASASASSGSGSRPICTTPSLAR